MKHMIITLACAFVRYSLYRVTCLILFLFLANSSYNEIVGQEAIHYVVALDCSGSMVPEGDKDSVRWKKALESVESIQKKVRSSDKFDIVCFAKDKEAIRIVHDVKSCRLIKSYNGKRQDTCILEAWLQSEQLFRPDENVYFYLITDGLEDHDNVPERDTGEQEHNKLLKGKIMSFCSSGGRGDRQGFYENLIGTLNNSSNNPIYEALLASDCFHIEARGKLEPDFWLINEEEGKKDYQKDFVYNTNMSEKGINNIDHVCATITDPYFSAKIVGNSLTKYNNNAKLTLVVSLKESVPDEIKRKGPYEFIVEIKSDLNSNPKVVIKEQAITIRVNFNKIFVSGSFNPHELTFDYPDEMDKDNRVFRGNVDYILETEIGRNVIDNVYANSNDRYFSASIEGSSIKDSHFVLLAKCESDVPDEISQGRGYYEFKVAIGSKENAKTVIESDSINIRINYNEKTVTVPRDSVVANVEWRSECSPQFMAKLYDGFSPVFPQPIVVCLKDKIEFNRKAIDSGASVLCMIDPSGCSLSPEEYEVFYGEEKVDSTFRIIPQDIKDLIVLVKSGAKEGDYTLLVKCKTPNDIDRIKGFNNLADYSYPIHFTVNRKTNWGGFVFWALIILLLLIVLLLIYKSILLPYKKGIINEKIRLQQIITRFNNARNDYMGILSRYRLDPIRNLQCGINDSDPMINLSTNEKILSLNRIPEYLACVIFNGNHKEEFFEAVFKEFCFNPYFEALKDVEKEEGNIRKFLKKSLSDVLPENEREELVRNNVKKRFTLFEGDEMPENLLVFLKRDIQQNYQTLAVVYNYDANMGRWEKTESYLYKEVNPLEILIPINEDKLKIYIY